jgi:DNA replication protein DnaC
MSEAEWLAHDAEVAAERAHTAAEAQRARGAANITIVKGHDAPIDCIYPPEGMRATNAVAKLAHAMARPGKRLVTLAGGVGSGKTTAAVQWLIQTQGKPLFIPAPSLVQRARPKPWLPPIWESATAIVLDDVGTEHATRVDRFLEEFNALLTHVHATHKRMVITANMGMDDFRKIYGERIESRFRQAGRWEALTDGDMRKR